MTAGFQAFDKGIPSMVIKQQRQYAEQRQQAEHILRLLKESERVLDILRPISPVARTLDQATIQKFMKIMPEARPADSYDKVQDTLVVDPRDYFARRFPEQIKNYGPAFFGSVAMIDGRQIFMADSINDLAFAAILSGDHSLGHQVVYHHAEDEFYFQDYRVGAFCPTSESKLGLLVSHYLVGCSEACHPLAARAILKQRTPGTIKTVITSAKAMLEADGRFFHGKDGRRRYVDGKYIEPNDEPSYQQFVRKAIVREPTAKLTVGDAFHRYYQFCKEHAMQPLTRSDFKELVAEVIRQMHGLGIRHDIPNAEGKQSHGWLGIDCRLEDATCFGRN